MSHWRTQLLPFGTVDYHGRALFFTPEYLTEIADAFRDGAIADVPFLLHFSRARIGTVSSVEVVADGLDAIIETTSPGDNAITTIIGLTSAPRIIADYDYRACDETIKRAPVIVHVLGTKYPLITGLRGWKLLAAGEN